MHRDAGAIEAIPNMPNQAKSKSFHVTMEPAHKKNWVGLPASQLGLLVRTSFNWISTFEPPKNGTTCFSQQSTQKTSVSC